MGVIVRDKYRTQYKRPVGSRTKPAPIKRRRRKHDGAPHGVSSVSTLQFVICVILLAAAATMYVGHVHATDALMRQVQVAGQRNMNLNLRLNRLKGEYDRLTAPDVMYPRASGLGLVEGYGYGKTVYIPPSRSNNR